MRAQLPKREPEVLARWQSLNLYHRCRVQAADEGRAQFIFHDGPPYANGELHVGHAVNKVLKDIVTKSRTLSGLDAPFVPGWDCHGLPIELNVEKSLGKRKQDLTDAEFRAACRAYASGQVEQQKAVFKRLGVLADWDNPYLTMNPTFEANVIRHLAKIVERGHIEFGLRPVHWCMRCASSLAEAEVEYQDKTSPAIDVAFDAIDLTAIAQTFDRSLEGVSHVYFPIWTTTPWTLPANQAVAVHPNLDYDLIKVGNQAFVVAHDRVEAISQRYAWSGIKCLATVIGRQLESLQLQHPLLDRKVPVLLGEHVTTDAGTGLVHTAPAHGLEDYALGLAHGLPIEGPVDQRGCYVEHAAVLPGEHVLKANPKIVDMLKARGRLLAYEEIQHSYPHCWRHQTPVIFRATPQWFISMEAHGLRQGALDAIKTVVWHPAWGEKRISNMIASRPDWCISRQRKWGVPMSLIVNKDTGHLHPEMPTLMRQVADAVDAEGLEAWFGSDLTRWLGDDAEQWEKISDIVEVWFDSGVTHACVLDARPELRSPADLYLEGSDQYRGWFHSSLLTSVALHERGPYKTVVSHGYTVDAHGRKMSKSIGNILPAQKAIDDLGADVLRLWIASTDYTRDMVVSEEQFKQTSDAYRRIRNTLRYLLSNLNDFDAQADAIQADQLLALDQWALGTLNTLEQDVLDAYQTYQFHRAYKALLKFCSIEMGGLYLDVIKDRLYTMPAGSLARRSAQTALDHILKSLVRLIAPVLSFTAEEVWQLMADEPLDSVFLTRWVDSTDIPAEQLRVSHASWAKIMAVRTEVYRALEQARQVGQIGSGLEADVQVYAEPELVSCLEQLGDELRFVWISSEARVLPADQRPDNALKAEHVTSCWIHVDAAQGEKCERCWHRREDVGMTAEYPSFCGRCAGNLSGKAEARQFA